LELVTEIFNKYKDFNNHWVAPWDEYVYATVYNIRVHVYDSH